VKGEGPRSTPIHETEVGQLRSFSSSLTGSSQDDGTLTTIGRNTAYVIVRGVVVLAALFVLAPIVIRLLGLEAYGVYALLKTFTAYSLILDLGMGVTVTRCVAEYYARHDERGINRVFNTYFVVYVTVAIGVLGAAFVASDWLVTNLLKTSAVSHSELVLVLRLATGVFAFSQSLTVFASLYNGVQRMDLAAKVGVIAAAISLVTSTALLLLGWGLRGLVLGDGLAAVVALLSYLALSSRTLPFVQVNPLDFDFAELRRLAAFNSLSAIQIVLGVVHYQSDKVIISFFLGLQWLAFYDLGFRLMSAVASPFGALTTATLPAIARVFVEAGIARVEPILKTVLQTTAAVGVPTYLLLFALGPQVATVWLHTSLPSASLALQALAVSFLIGILTGPQEAVFYGIGRADGPVVPSMITVGLNVALSLVLVQLLGFVGILVSVVLSRLVGAVVYQAVFSRITHIRIWTDLFDSIRLPSLSTLFLLVPIYFLATRLQTPVTQLLVSILSFLIAYAVVAILLGIHRPLVALVPLPLWLKGSSGR
jgi:O-antigen/teichoic acid export membrane protein